MVEKQTKGVLILTGVRVIFARKGSVPEKPETKRDLLIIVPEEGNLDVSMRVSDKEGEQWLNPSEVEIAEEYEDNENE